MANLSVQPIQNQPTLAPTVTQAPSPAPSAAPLAVSNPAPSTTPLPVVNASNKPQITSVGTATQQTPVTIKPTLDDFGQTVKAKYPQYADKPDAVVANAVLQKYPQYQTKVSMPQYQVPSLGDNIASAIGSTLDGSAGLYSGIKAVLNPFVTVGVTGYNKLAAIAKGVKDVADGNAPDSATTLNDVRTSENTNRDVPGFGSVEPLFKDYAPGTETKSQIASEALRPIGTVAEIASNFVGGGELASGAEDAAPTIASRILKGGLTGGAIGATQGAGQALSDDSTYQGSFGQGLLNVGKQTGLGAIIGALAGSIINPVMGKFADESAVASGVIPARLDKSVEDVLNYSNVQKAAETASGLDHSQMIIKNNLPLDVQDNVFQAKPTQDAIDTITHAEQPIRNALLASEQGTVNVDDLKAQTEAAIKARYPIGTIQDRELAYANNEIDAAARQKGIKNPDGSVSLSLTDLDSLKSDAYRGSRYEQGTTDNARANTNRIRAAVAKQNVYANIQNPDTANIIQAMDDRYGQLQDLSDAIGKRDGKTIAGSSKTNKYIQTLVGSVAGSHFGPLGTIAGAEIGAKLADFMGTGSFDSGTTAKLQAIFAQNGTEGAALSARAQAITDDFNAQVAQAKADAAAAAAERIKSGKLLPAPVDKIIAQPATGNANGGQYYSGIQGTTAKPVPGFNIDSSIAGVPTSGTPKATPSDIVASAKEIAEARQLGLKRFAAKTAKK